MSSQFRNCRVCALQYCADDLDAHELTCLQRFHEQVDVGVDNESSQSNQESQGQGTDLNSPGIHLNLQNDESHLNEEEKDIHTISSSSKLIHSPLVQSDKVKRESTPQHTPNNYSQQTAEEQHSKQNSLSGRSNDESASSSSKSNFSVSKRKLFPKTKKYRYYPVTCDYCQRKFQPDKLKAHNTKYHLKETSVGSRRVLSTATRSSADSGNPDSGRARSVGGMPRRLQVCYICGKLYGSKSLKIHEPKCLDKWKIQNDQLPPTMRVPEPVKPEPILMGAAGIENHDTDFDPVMEAAFQIHLKSLIPCIHCGRTFSPDRVQRHQACCIKKPKLRECAAPVGGEIPR